MKDKLLRSLKIAVAALAAIALAGELGLKYSATAGIITVLSIRNTKKETLKSAVNRGLAFLCALLLAGLFFSFLGYGLGAFALYLFFFALLCLWMGWEEAIAMDSVLITHLLTEQAMTADILLNEVLLLVVGAGIGVLVNLHLHRKARAFEELSDEVDNQIKGILHRMADWLQKEDRSGYGSDCFEKLESVLAEAKLCAASNYNNAFFESSTKELDYITMREKQSAILKEIYQNIKSIRYLPEQAGKVAAFIYRVEQDYHRENTVKGLLEELEKFFGEMKAEELPESREEFEARAILFYILMQLKNLLEAKREFVEAKHG